MNATDPLAQLRDIHLPDAVAWWPPAPGWWIFLGLVLATLFFLGQWFLRRHRALGYRREARRELEAAFNNWQAERDSSTYLQTVNSILKRVALQSFDRESVAGLSGSDWSEFLDKQAGGGFSESGLTEKLYSADAEGCDTAAIHRLCLDWVRQHRSQPC
jgi:hypothetical protein